MNRYLFASLMLLFPFATPAQSPDYNDLMFSYVDGDYEKCVWKAMRYIDRDATRRDPLPHL